MKKLGLMLLLVFSLALSSFGKTPAEIDETQALHILNKDCAVCHLAADHPGALFLNRARLSEPDTLALLQHLIERSRMPPAHADFKNTPDGKILLRWIKRQRAELKNQK